MKYHYNDGNTEEFATVERYPQGVINQKEWFQISGCKHICYENHNYSVDTIGDLLT